MKKQLLTLAAAISLEASPIEQWETGAGKLSEQARPEAIEAALNRLPLYDWELEKPAVAPGGWGAAELEEQHGMARPWGSEGHEPNALVAASLGGLAVACGLLTASAGRRRTA